MVLQLGHTKPPAQWVTGHSHGVKKPGHGVNYPPPSSPEFKKRRELYLYSLSVPSWQVMG